MKFNLTLVVQICLLIAACSPADFSGPSRKRAGENADAVTIAGTGTQTETQTDPANPNGEDPNQPKGQIVVGTEVPINGVIVEVTATPTPTPSPTPTPTAIPFQTCTKSVSGAIFASDGMYNQNPACGPTGQIDMVTNLSVTFSIPANAKNLKITSGSFSHSRGSCASVVAAFSTMPAGPYGYFGNCQRQAPEFERTLPIASSVQIIETVPASAGKLMLYCKGPQLVSLGLGKNAAGHEIAAMEMTTNFVFSYEMQGACQ